MERTTMSEPTSTPPVATGPASTAPASQPNSAPSSDPAPAPGPDNGPKGGETALRADLATERRKRQELEHEIQKIRDRDLTDLEKAQKQVQESSTRLAQLEAEATRTRVALKAGVPAEHVHRLQGATEDELAADAVSLMKLLAPRPLPDPTQGPRGATGVTDMNSLIRQAAGR